MCARVLSFGCARDGGCEVRELFQRRSARPQGLDQILRSAVRGEDSFGASVSECDGCVCFVQTDGDGSDLELFVVQSLVVELDSAEVCPQESQDLASAAILQVIQLLAVLLGEHLGNYRVSFAKDLLLQLR